MTDPITILVPCKDQKREFLLDALSSIAAQSSPDWRVLVLFEEDSPDHLRELVGSFRDERIRYLVSPGNNFGAALNHGMEQADTTFVGILLSDDRLTSIAVETIQSYRRLHPDADYFYSSRVYIDAAGRRISEVMPSKAEITVEHFRERGSAVKHMMCWRRSTGLEIGGMDEDLSPHGCDDYDFPWRMAEAGCRFQPISECLYEYRRHTDFERLTTNVPVNRQIEILQRMFRKHQVSEADYCAYVQRAVDGYLIRSHDEEPAEVPIYWSGYTEAGPGMKDEFLSLGYRSRYFFPHRVYRLPKGGPDGFRLALAMTGATDPGSLREIVLYGLPPAIDEFPGELFFDDDLVWHQQQFGVPAQIATANIALDGDRMYGFVFISDIVQRISRRRESKTRIELVFKGWIRLLYNAVLDYAVDLGVRTVFTPRSQFAIEHTDPSRDIQPALYERIYDSTVLNLFEVEPEGDWWRIDVDANRKRRVPLAKKVDRIRPRKTICIYHDVERGLGHVVEDPPFAEQIDGPAREALERMLAVEEQVGIKATYNVVGKLWDTITPAILSRGHACSFHSYDHVPSEDSALAQLESCRQVDYRVKGYRPPQSKITPQLNDANLALHNFEWLASSRYSLNAESPFMENGIVKIPVHLDDFDLYRGHKTFSEWEAEALDLIENNEFVAIGLHDCYFEFWLPQYESFLRKLLGRGRLATFDEIAVEVTLAHARWK